MSRIDASVEIRTLPIELEVDERSRKRRCVGYLHVLESGHVRMTLEDALDRKWFESSGTAAKYLRGCYAQCWICASIRVGPYEIWRWGMGSRDLFLGRTKEEDSLGGLCYGTGIKKYH